MKSKSAIRNFLAAIGASIIALSSASAATLYWDGGDEDILTDGNGASGGTSGTWNTAILNWDAGVSPHVDWNNSNNDSAVFAGAAGTVTLGADVTVGGLAFSTNAYNIAPGTGPFGITFGAPGDINVSTGTTTINAAISGSAITKTGGGTLRLTPTNTFTGLNLNGGTTAVNGTTDSLGAAGSTITVRSDSTLNQGGSGAITLDKSLAVNSEVTLTFIHGNNNWTILGPVSGSGIIRPNDAGSVFQRTLNLRSAVNTFTGTIRLSNNRSAVAVNSLADSSGSGTILFTGADAGFRFGAGGDGPASSLALNHRQLEFTAAGGTPYEDWTTGGELFEDDASGDLGIADAWSTVLVPGTAGISGPTITNLGSGRATTITFRARAATAGTKVRFVMQSDVYQARDFTLSTSWDQYTCNHTTAETSPRLRIHYFNTATSPAAISLGLGDLPGASATGYQTARTTITTDPYRALGPVNPAQDHTLPAESITSYVIDLSATLNPFDPARFRISRNEHVGNGVSLAIPAQPGHGFSLWRSTTLADGSWQEARMPSSSNPTVNWSSPIPRRIPGRHSTESDTLPPRET